MQGDKHDDQVFGNCPRMLCQYAPVLPVGTSSELGVSHVMLFCPRCEEVYLPPSSAGLDLSALGGMQGGGSGPGMASAAGTGIGGAAGGTGSLTASARTFSPRDLDGAFFGPTFPHLLLLTKQGSHPVTALTKTNERYVPRIYGFRVANQRGRMGLRDSCYATAHLAELEADGAITHARSQARGAGGTGAPLTSSSAAAMPASSPRASAVGVAASTAVKGKGSEEEADIANVQGHGRQEVSGSRTPPRVPFRHLKPPLTSPYTDVLTAVGNGEGSGGTAEAGGGGRSVSTGSVMTGAGTEVGYGMYSGSGGGPRAGQAGHRGGAGMPLVPITSAVDDFRSDDEEDAGVVGQNQAQDTVHSSSAHAINGKHAGQPGGRAGTGAGGATAPGSGKKSGSRGVGDGAAAGAQAVGQPPSKKRKGAAGEG